jgi:hypothetical protein
MKRTSCSPILRALAVAALIFTSCKAATSIGQTPTPGANLAETVAAEPPSAGLPATITTEPQNDLAPTASLPPDLATPTGAGPTVTALVVATLPPAVQPAITLEPGLTLFTHPEIPEFVFPADSTLWEQAPTTGYAWAFLAHKRLPECSISAVPGRGIGAPQRVQRWQLGRLQWFIFDDGHTALASIEQPTYLYLDLLGLDNAECRADQQAVMEKVLLADEVSGKVAVNPLPTATQRPPLPGFECPNTPPTRLRVGDIVHIITDDLWLRSAPRPTDDTEVKTYDRTAPVFIQVLDGPVCGEKFVYWQVSVGLIGEGSPDPITGWFAEGDLREYYLAVGR